MKSICFLFTKKRTIINSMAAADMKLIIALHCSILKLANAPSLRLYTQCMWSNSRKIYCQNKTQTNSLTAPSHLLLVRDQEILHPRHLHHQKKSQEKAQKLIHMENLHRSIFFPTFDSDNALSRSNQEWDHCA